MYSVCPLSAHRGTLAPFLAARGEPMTGWATCTVSIGSLGIHGCVSSVMGPSIWNFLTGELLDSGPPGRVIYVPRVLFFCPTVHCWERFWVLNRYLKGGYKSPQNERISRVGLITEILRTIEPLTIGTMGDVTIKSLLIPYLNARIRRLLQNDYFNLHPVSHDKGKRQQQAAVLYK